MFLRLFCLIFLFISYNARAEIYSKHGSTDVNCPKGTSPKVTKRGNDIIIVCLDKHGKKKYTKTKIHKEIAPIAKKRTITPVFKKTYIAPVVQQNAIVPSAVNTPIQADQTIIRHYYVPLQKKVDSKTGQPVNSPDKMDEKSIEPEGSISDGFDGFFVGLMYNVTILNASNSYTTNPGLWNVNPPKGTESNNLLEHGPIITLGYSSLMWNKRLLIGAEVRMGYSIPGSNNFSSVTQQNGLYTYNNFASSIFNWPSFHFRVGILLFERLLPYFTAGVGVYQINYNGPQLTANGYKGISASGSQVSANFPIGAGLEFAINKHVHLRIEYLYSFFISTSASFSDPNGGNPITINYNYTMNSSSILAGVMICF